MIPVNSVVNYKLCVKCNKELAESSIYLCKYCKPKREYNRTLSKSQDRTYVRKFEVNASSCRKKLASESHVLEQKFIYSRFRLKKEISHKTTTKTPALFFTLYWDQFNNFDDFSSFIANSGQVSTLYFMYNSTTIQQKQKYQQFVISKESQLPAILTTNQLIPVPISRPLLLLAQKSYWDDLITSYFKNIHPMFPIFSIHSFNLKTVTKPLLSAIYYGGFQYMKDKPPELVRYFNEYAKRNIKEAIWVVSLQNAQAVALYSFILVLLGNFKLFRACQTHAIRMSYALGLHLNLKILTALQRYDRMRFFFKTCALHVFFYGMGSLSLNQLIEIGDFNTELIDPKYQIPNSNCVFSFDTEDENIVYGICLDIRFALNYLQSHHIYNFSKCSKYLIQSEFDAHFINYTQKYIECMEMFDFLLRKYPHLQLNIQIYKINLILAHHVINLEMYTILRHKVNNLTPNQISKMLDECVKLFNTIIESQGICQTMPTFPYIAGLKFISIYKIANLQEKSLIKQKLDELFDYLSKGPIIDKLSYLIIKKEYESILRSNK